MYMLKNRGTRAMPTVAITKQQFPQSSISVVSPDSQAQVTVAHHAAFVTALHPHTVWVEGFLGNVQRPAQAADLVFNLRTAQGAQYTWSLPFSADTGSGAYMPSAPTTVLALADLQAAGWELDFSTGRAQHRGVLFQMECHDRTWHLPLFHVISALPPASDEPPPQASPRFDGSRVWQIPAFEPTGARASSK